MWRLVLGSWLMVVPVAHAGAPRPCDSDVGHRELKQLNEDPPVGGSIVFALDLAGRRSEGRPKPPNPGMKALAPGLLALAIEADPDADPQLKPTKLPPLLAAPAIKRLRRIVQGGRRGTSIEVVAELAGKPPEGVLALVVLDRGVGRSWSHAPRDEGRYVVYAPSGRCEDPIPGTVETNAGDLVRLAWVDRFGRLSQPSGATKVTAETQ